MIFKTAYDTTACAGQKTDKIVEDIKIARIHGDIVKYDSHNIYTICGGSSLADNIPSFAHPLALIYNDENSLICDMRSYGKMDINTHEFVVRNKVEYNLQMLRTKLNSIFVNERATALRDVSPLPIALFASWISEFVGRRYALDPKEQFDLGILAAIFYNSLFSDEIELEERDKLKIINSVSKALRASTQDVIDIVDKVSVIKNVFEFCSYATDITGSIRLKELSPGILFTILGGTWFGTNSKEMIAVALEHPPTWISILLTVYTDKSFKKSQIAMLTERTTFKKSSEDFIRSTLMLTKSI